MSRYAKGTLGLGPDRAEGRLQRHHPVLYGDLRHLNRGSIRTTYAHTNWFQGALLVSEPISPTVHPDGRMGADEGPGASCCSSTPKLQHARGERRAAKRAEDAGAEMVLLSYPPSFYRTSCARSTITEAFCAQTKPGGHGVPGAMWVSSGCIRRRSPLSCWRDGRQMPNVADNQGWRRHAGHRRIHRGWNRLAIGSSDHAAGAAGIPLATIVPLQLIRDVEHDACARSRMLGCVKRGRFDERCSSRQVDPARRANDRIGVAGETPSTEV